jgi:hypothetical protein
MLIGAGTTADRVAAATPAERDRFADLLRVASILVVVAGGWLGLLRPRPRRPAAAADRGVPGRLAMLVRPTVTHWLRRPAPGRRS